MYKNDEGKTPRNQIEEKTAAEMVSRKEEEEEEEEEEVAEISSDSNPEGEENEDYDEDDGEVEADRDEDEEESKKEERSSESPPSDQERKSQNVAALVRYARFSPTLLSDYWQSDGFKFSTWIAVFF